MSQSTYTQCPFFSYIVSFGGKNKFQKMTPVNRHPDKSLARWGGVALAGGGSALEAGPLVAWRARERSRRRRARARGARDRDETSETREGRERREVGEVGERKNEVPRRGGAEAEGKARARARNERERRDESTT